MGRLNPHPEYGRVGWRKRAKHQLAVEPFCRMCAEDGVSVAATVADHVEPVGDDMRKFYYGPLQSLCKPHHDAAKKRDERRGFSTRIGVDGMPTDPNHPFYCTVARRKRSG